VVQSARFSELLQQGLTRNRNRAIETAHVIEELIEMAKQFQEAAARGEAGRAWRSARTRRQRVGLL
jgi:type I restriction enzyme R subunit